MNRWTFNKIVNELPGLTELGFVYFSNPRYKELRSDFLNKAKFLQQTNDALEFFAHLSKSETMTSWHKDNCTPNKIRRLVEWSAQGPISLGAIVVAAIHSGFAMQRYGSEPFFNIFQTQLEGEFETYQFRQSIRKAAS